MISRRKCVIAEIRMRAWIWVDNFSARLARDRDCIRARTDAAISAYIRARMRVAK